MDYKEEFKKLFLDVTSKDKERIKRQIPNMLTLIRGALTPILLVIAIIIHNIQFAFIVTVISALTDCFDGWYARKNNVTSEFGAMLDTIADKLFILFMILPILTIENTFFTVVLVLEILISVINIYSKIIGNKPRSSVIGKIKTVILDIAIALCYLNFIVSINKKAIHISLIIAITMQIITIIGYIRLFLKQNKDNKK